MAAAVLFPVPFFVSGHQILLVSDAQAVLRPMAPAGSAGLPAWPHSHVKPGVA